MRDSSPISSLVLRWLGSVTACALIGCAGSDIKPVDIYPEDMCSFCRMAISEKAFAAEIVTSDRDVRKFDDIGCMEEFVARNKELTIVARFVTDTESGSWVALERSTIVRTNIRTPMGSGKIAFADSLKAAQFAADHPPLPSKATDQSCCSEGKPHP